MVSEESIEDLEKRIAAEVKAELDPEAARQNYHTRIELAVHAMKLAEQGDIPAAKEQLVQIIHDHEAYQPESTYIGGGKWKQVYGYHQGHYDELCRIEGQLEESDGKEKLSERAIKNYVLFLLLLKAGDNEKCKFITKYGGRSASDIEKMIRHPDRIPLYEKMDAIRESVSEDAKSAAICVAFPPTYWRRNFLEKENYSTFSGAYGSFFTLVHGLAICTLAISSLPYALLAAIPAGGSLIYEITRWAVRKKKQLAEKGKEQEKMLFGNIRPQLPPHEE